MLVGGDVLDAPSYKSTNFRRGDHWSSVLNAENVKEKALAVGKRFFRQLNLTCTGDLAAYWRQGYLCEAPHQTFIKKCAIKDIVESSISLFYDFGSVSNYLISP